MPRIDISRARREAKALLAAARAGDPAARAWLRSDRQPRLADAQHAVARRHGLANWRALLTAGDLGRHVREAARIGDDEMLYNLLVAGADPNAADQRTGQTALHVAAAADQLDTVSVLVTWDPADKRRRDAKGRTALDLARPGSPVAAVLGRLGQGGQLDARHARLDHAVGVALFGHVSRAPGVERWPVGDGFGFRSGLGDNTRNGVIASRATAPEVADALRRLAEVPASWLLPSVEAASMLGVTLEEAGCEPERDSVFMHAGLEAFAAARDPRVTETTDVTAVVGVDLAEAALLLSGPAGRAFVIDAAASVITFTTATTIRVEHLNVAREHRRQGLARALLRHVAAVAREDGVINALVSPTAATVPLYERLGFTVERCAPDVWFYLP